MTVQFTKLAEPIPGYKLLEPLGRGGFGEVWKAEAPGGVLKAIKLVYGSLRSADDGGLVKQELKALDFVKGVRHPYILSMDRYDILDGQLVIVMELADQNLWDRFGECVTAGRPGIPRDELLRYMMEAAEALDLMNIQYSLQHSDIKPQNIFLVHKHVKVADFGLVKDLKETAGITSGCFSPLYAAPETFEGRVSACSDQYSLAIVFQELLTGKRPFNGTNSRMLLVQHLRQAPDVSALSPADQQIIRRALAKKPEERFPNCGQLVRALRAAGLPVAKPMSRPGLAQRPPIRKPSSTINPNAPKRNTMFLRPTSVSDPATMRLKSDDPALKALHAAAAQSGAAYQQLTFAIECPGCGYTGQVPTKFKGQTVKCRECSRTFVATGFIDGSQPPAGQRRPSVSTPTPVPAALLSQAPAAEKPVPPTKPMALPSKAALAQAAAAQAAAVRPSAAPAHPAVECPVCGSTEHLADQGRLKCKKCGCVHRA